MISSLLTKSFASALVGSPIAYSLNVSILPSFTNLINENVFLAGVLITTPFLIVSAVRMFLIDIIYEKYHINLDVMYHIKRRMIRN